MPDDALLAVRQWKIQLLGDHIGSRRIKDGGLGHQGDADAAGGPEHGIAYVADADTAGEKAVFAAFVLDDGAVAPVMNISL